MSDKKMKLELNDKKNIGLIKQALKDYEDGALIEARDALAEVVKNIDDFDIATSNVIC